MSLLQLSGHQAYETPDDVAKFGRLSASIKLERRPATQLRFEGGHGSDDLGPIVVAGGAERRDEVWALLVPDHSIDGDATARAP